MNLNKMLFIVSILVVSIASGKLFSQDGLNSTVSVNKWVAAENNYSQKQDPVN